MNLGTSQDEPLRIDAVPDPPGEIGLPIWPGKRGPAVIRGVWQRDLDIDIEVLRGRSPKIGIGLMKPGEYAGLGVVEFPNRAAVAGLRYVSIAIPDGSAPGAPHIAAWRAIAPRVHAALGAGVRVLIHCRRSRLNRLRRADALNSKIEPFWCRQIGQRECLPFWHGKLVRKRVILLRHALELMILICDAIYKKRNSAGVDCSHKGGKGLIAVSSEVSLPAHHE